MHIKEHIRIVEDIAGMFEVYLKNGVDTIIGCLTRDELVWRACRLAEERTGKKIHHVELAIFDTDDTEEARKSAEAVIKKCADMGVEVCLPLHMVVERLVSKQARKIPRIEDYLYMIRENGMIPGLSAHMPEIITYADENSYDVETYVQIYNAIGFMMQVEIECVHQLIWRAKKPVLTIKPMAAGHLNPLVGINFSFATIRDMDMVAVGCMTAREAEETVEYARAAIERRRNLLRLF